jgi:hypothetical protein
MGTWLYPIEITLSRHTNSTAGSSSSINCSVEIFRKMARASGVNRPWPAQAPQAREVVCFDQGDHHLLSRRVLKSGSMQLHIRIGVVKIAQKSICANRYVFEWAVLLYRFLMMHLKPT